MYQGGKVVVSEQLESNKKKTCNKRMYNTGNIVTLGKEAVDVLDGLSVVAYCVC